MYQLRWESVSYALIFIAWLMVWSPVCVFLLRAWRARRDLIFDFFDDEALRLYYAEFFPAEELTKLDAVGLKANFRRRFYALFGRRFYLVPILLLASVAAIGLWAVAVFLQRALAHPAANDGLLWVGVSAFLGAYVWVVNDQLGRLSSRDFTPHDVYTAIFRFLIALPLGYCFGKIAATGMAVPIAFFLGTFPADTLFKYGRRFVDQRLNLGESADDQSTELEKLQCVNKAQAERLGDVGVSTIGELAWSNPVDLTIRSNLDFNYIIDTMSQALLWVYAEDSTKQLYKFGLRGAMEVSNLLAAVDKNDENAKHALGDAAGELKMTEESLRHMFDEVATDPYTKFLVNIWH
jgi:hypothetical protein